MVLRLRKSYLVILLTFFVSFFFFSENKAVTASGGKSVNLPVIMYHQITKDPKKAGKYVITEEQLEKDLDYIASAGYATVTVKDLIDYVNGRKNLPEKPVMLTFDDGHETAYTILYPLLKEKGMCAVVSVIGSLADLYTEINDHNDAYSYLTWEEIEMLSDTPEIEIQNHSYDMHTIEKGGRRGIAPVSTETEESYFSAISSDVGKMQLQLMKKGKTKATAMVYPYGSYTDLTLEVCKDLGFLCTMTCEERINSVVRFQPECLYNLGRYNRSGDISTETFFSENIILSH